MKLLFYGGCINQQQGLPAHLHYHQLLKELLAASGNGRIDINLHFYSTYQEIAYATAPVPSDTDIVFFFLRPYPLYPLTKPLIRYTNKGMRSNLTLHPIFNNSNYWQDAAIETEVPVRKKKRSTFHKLGKGLNEKTGDWLKLDRWAIDYILRLLQHFKTALPNNTRLLIMGPPAYGANKRLNRICSELAPQVEQWCKAQHCSYLPMQVLPDGSGKSYFAEDGIHISAEGHQQLAQELFKLLQ